MKVCSPISEFNYKYPEKKLNILHYTIGLNKNRGGGLTKYTDDLAIFQSYSNNVFLLYPGKINAINKKVFIKEEKKYQNVNIFSIVNPLGLPMMFGIRDMDYLTKKSDRRIWHDFLKKNKIDVIHMHTLMGIYEEFLDAANELKIPILYTTHDYFGLCSKQTLFYNNEFCKEWKSCANCPRCNLTAFSKPKVLLIHSSLFFKLRKMSLFKKIKSKVKSNLNSNDDEKKKYYYDENEDYNQKYYINLRNKMIRMFDKISRLHYNSSNTRKIFENFISKDKGVLINITHADIVDNRKIKDFNHQKLNITYLGPATKMKGFNQLIDILDSIYNKSQNFNLNIYTFTNIERPYITKHGNSYRYSDLKSIMEATDILISPSTWMETFGFTVAEAMSFGVPVLVSENTGAKDLVKDKFNGIIFSFENLADIISNLVNNRKMLSTFNSNIFNDKFYLFEDHCNEITNLYYNMINLKNKEDS